MIRKPWAGIQDELKRDGGICQKYDKPGIYGVYIEGKLVYVGKSKDMLLRLAQHIFYTNNLNWTKTHKYRIFALAQLMGYNVRFDVLYTLPSSSTSGKKNIDDILGEREAELINQHLPPLNYQIPKIDNYKSFTINKKASTITLQEILGKDGK